MSPADAEDYREPTCKRRALAPENTLVLNKTVDENSYA